MIREEAHIAGQGKKLDFQAVFDYFDEDLSKQISITEFKDTLERWQLINSLSLAQIPTLVVSLVFLIFILFLISSLNCNEIM
jgi:hypothetical protein